MTSTHLRLLEGFALQQDHASVELPRGTQRLIALLALRGPSHRCVVAGTLWPEVPESQALASLRTGIWRVNRKLPGCIVCDGPGVATSQSMSVDSLEQERVSLELLREHVDDAEWITQRLEILWRSELLPGWYDDWVIFERERLSALRLHALEHAAVVLTRRGLLGAALQLALEAVRAEPLRETANAALIRVYLAEGNVSDAVHHYEMFRRFLQRELGVEPSQALEELLPTSAVR
jgi:DNA-binding SARP family transcriptional activator